MSTAKITTFLAKSLPKFHEPATSNDIRKPLYTHFFITIFTTLVAPNKQFLNLKLLVGFLGQAVK